MGVLGSIQKIRSAFFFVCKFLHPVMIEFFCRNVINQVPLISYVFLLGLTHQLRLLLDLFRPLLFFILQVTLLRDLLMNYPSAVEVHWISIRRFFYYFFYVLFLDHIYLFLFFIVCVIVWCLNIFCVRCVH